MNLSPLIKEGIKAHALREKPQECCGLIVDRDNTKTSIPCRNSSEKPAVHFSINPSDYVRASRKG